MVFCNMNKEDEKITNINVTILILIDGFLQFIISVKVIMYLKNVTILILIDGFLQYIAEYIIEYFKSVSQSLF